MQSRWRRGILCSLILVSISCFGAGEGGEEVKVPNEDITNNPKTEVTIIESNKSKENEKLNLTINKEFPPDGSFYKGTNDQQKKITTVTIGDAINSEDISIYINQGINSEGSFSINFSRESLKQEMEEIKKNKITTIYTGDKLIKNLDSKTITFEDDGNRGNERFLKIPSRNIFSKIVFDSPGGMSLCYGYNGNTFESDHTAPIAGYYRNSFNGFDTLEYNKNESTNKEKYLLGTWGDTKQSVTLNSSSNLASRVRDLYFSIDGAKDTSGNTISQSNVSSETMAVANLISTDKFFSKSTIKMTTTGYGMTFKIKSTSLDGQSRDKGYTLFATGVPKYKADSTDVSWVEKNVAFNKKTSIGITGNQVLYPNSLQKDRWTDTRFSYNGNSNVQYLTFKKASFYEMDMNSSDTCGTLIGPNEGYRKSIISGIDRVYYEVVGNFDTTLTHNYENGNLVAPGGVYKLGITGELKRPNGSIYYKGIHDVYVDVVDSNTYQREEYLFNQADDSLVNRVDYIFPEVGQLGISFGSEYSKVYYSKNDPGDSIPLREIKLGEEIELECDNTDPNHVHNEKLFLTFSQENEGEFATLIVKNKSGKKLDLRSALDQSNYSFYLVQGRNVYGRDGSKDRIHRKMKYVLKHPNENDIGTIKMQIDRRVLQHVSSSEKVFVFGNGEFGKLAKKVKLDGYVKLDTSQVNTGNLINSGNINEAVVRDKPKRVYYDNYKYFYFGNDEAGGFSEDIGIKKGVPVAQAGDTISIRVNKGNNEELKFYIEDSKGKIYEGIGKIEYVGPQTLQGYSGSGQIDMSAGGVGTFYKFNDFGPSEDGGTLNLDRVGETVEGNDFIKEESTFDSSNLIDFYNVFIGSGQVGWANTVTDESEIVGKNKSVKLRNSLEVAIDKNGRLYLKKLVDEDFDIGWDEGNPITIKYYSVRQEAGNEENKYDIKVGEFTFKVMNKKKAFEIDGSNVLDFGKIAQRDYDQTIGKVEFFKVKNPDNLPLSYSFENNPVAEMKLTGTGATESDTISIPTLNVKNISKNQFSIEAEALVKANTKVGTYQGEINIIVTVGE